MTYKEKLEKELKAQIIMPIQRIVDALEKMAEEDSELQDAILKENRTLEECYKYIEKKARENTKGTVGCFADDTVFDWAVEYFKTEEKKEEEPAETEANDIKEEKKKADSKKKKTSKKKEEEKPVQLDPEAEGEDDDDDIDLG